MLCGLGAESSEAPSWAGEEGNTTAVFGQTRIPKGELQVLVWQDQRTVTDKNNHRMLPQTPCISVRKVNNIHQRRFYRDPKVLYGMTGVIVIVFLPRLHPILKAAKFIHFPTQRVIYKLSNRWVVLLRCKNTSNKTGGVRVLPTHLIHYSIFLFYTFRGKRDIW